VVPKNKMFFVSCNPGNSGSTENYDFHLLLQLILGDKSIGNPPSKVKLRKLKIEKTALRLRPEQTQIEATEIIKG
jgi:hypothetical protein